MARPKKQPHEQLSEVLKAGATVAEKEELRQMVAASGLGSEAEFIRRAVFGATITPAPGRLHAALITELNRIGSNINQIARNLNSGRQIRLEAEVVLAELRGVLEKVAASYGS